MDQHGTVAPRNTRNARPNLVALLNWLARTTSGILTHLAKVSSIVGSYGPLTEPVGNDPFSYYLPLQHVHGAFEPCS